MIGTLALDTTIFFCHGYAIPMLPRPLLPIIDSAVTMIEMWYRNVCHQMASLTPDFTKFNFGQGSAAYHTGEFMLLPGPPSQLKRGYPLSIGLVGLAQEVLVGRLWLVFGCMLPFNMKLTVWCVCVVYGQVCVWSVCQSVTVSVCHTVLLIMTSYCCLPSHTGQ